ncbi:MAG: aspartate--tRNA(Asn) ligase [Candidatus Micrarchaeota archaeon]|nr:aspartate--tRNA(Asn) ligase [Candidatus Micrarchaeota archaeon]
MTIEEILAGRQHAKDVNPSADGKEICLAGFVTNTRIVSKKLKFVVLEDWTGEVQLTLKVGQTDQQYIDMVEALTNQSVLAVKGTVKKSDLFKKGAELVPSEMHVVSKSETPLPVDITGMTESTLDTRLNWRFIDIRPYKRKMVFLLTSDFERYTRDFFHKEGIVEIHTPKLLGAPSESGAELFEFDYFGRPAYLAQSPQFYKQMAICSGMEKVFEVGPVFRAEKSLTYRHATEFTSLDVEVSYINSIDDVINLEERWLVYAMGKIKEEWGDRIKEYYGREVVVPKAPFPRISMYEAYDVLDGLGFEIMKGDDLDSAAEKALFKHMKEKTGSDFLFVTDYPVKVRPFYHMRGKDKHGHPITHSYDLLYKGLEITTGAQREHRYDHLSKQAVEKGLSPENIQFYLDFFRYGAPPHGGWGFGITRMIMQLLDLENIRESTLLPRDPNRLYP